MKPEQYTIEGHRCGQFCEPAKGSHYEEVETTPMHRDAATADIRNAYASASAGTATVTLVEPVEATILPDGRARRWGAWLSV